MGRDAEGAGVTAKQLHHLQPGDRARARRRFLGRHAAIASGCGGIVQVVGVSLHLGDRQQVDFANIKWRGGRVETLQAGELKKWTVLVQ